MKLMRRLCRFLPAAASAGRQGRSISAEDRSDTDAKEEKRAIDATRCLGSSRHGSADCVSKYSRMSPRSQSPRPLTFGVAPEP